MEGSWRVNELSESMWVSVVRLPEIDKYTLIEMEQKNLDEIIDLHTSINTIFNIF